MSFNGKISLFYFLITVPALLVSCNKIINSPTKLNISLVDSPGDYDAVNVEIDSVLVKFSNGEWQSISDFNPGIYNLLKYTGGNELNVTSVETSSSMLSQIRVAVGTKNTITVNGTDYDLYSPGGGVDIVLDVNQALDPGKDVQMVIDFDASSSIREASGVYLLRPVIRVYNKSTTGSISGNVMPADLNISIQAYSGSIIASTYAPKGTTSFIISGLPAGTYEVIFDPGNSSGYQQLTTDNNLSVSAGEVTDIGPVNVPKSPN